MGTSSSTAGSNEPPALTDAQGSNTHVAGQAAVAEVEDAAAANVITEPAAEAIDNEAPNPIRFEPGEAQREPYDWPIPPGSAATFSAGRRGISCDGQHFSRCQQACRAMGSLMFIAGSLLVLAGIFHISWASIWLWTLQNHMRLLGLGLMLIGVAMRCLGTSTSRNSTAAPPWDDPAAVHVDARRLPHFSFQVWNDTARFGSDAEALDKVLTGHHQDGKGPNKDKSFIEDLLNEPDLRKLVKEKKTAESAQQAKRAAAAKKELVTRCREDLEAGLSTRRLRQKLEPRCFVIDFSDGENHGVGEAATSIRGINAQIQMLRDSVSFLLTICTPYDEVVLRVTSPGGLVGDYGLASAQLSRFRRAGVHLVACVDVIAASGGYMLACIADHLVAAPFALLGSIGVVAGMPNVYRVLQRHEVDYLQFTAGRFKRTVGMLTKNSEEGVAKFQEELDAVHSAFTALVAEGRGSRIEGGAGAVATGEVFLGSEALNRGLVDEVCTSDEYLRRRAAEGVVIVEVRPAAQRRSWWKDVCVPLNAAVHHLVANGVAAVVSASEWASRISKGLSASTSSQGAAEWLLAAQAENQRPHIVI